MRPIFLAPALLALSSAAPALAQEQGPQEEAPANRPITDDTVTAGDVAKTPLSDLNLTRAEIDALLLQARSNPYDTKGLRRCSDIVAAVERLDMLLGEDLDIAEGRNRGVDPGRVAQWAVGTFIPFRGLIREVSGARAHERKVRDAIIGGMMRRAFLKGVGQQKGFRYPGRPAKPEEAEAHREHKAAEQRAQERREDIEKRARKEKRGRKDDGGQPSVSPPANQPVS